MLRDPSFGHAPGADAIRVVSGASGAAIAGAEATLYRWQWEQKPVRSRRAPPTPTASPASSCHRAATAAASPSSCATAATSRSGRRATGGGRLATGLFVRRLVFTDRAIYRPGQKLLWKILAYEGEAAKGSFRAVGGRGHYRGAARSERRGRGHRRGEDQRLRHRRRRARDPDRTTAPATGRCAPAPTARPRSRLKSTSGRPSR
ncbi:MAG: hypothetical protein M5U09_09365 [Gammaproteobacteria bacterium]|nr:hypothetical protein [Gammaproteobacteria bacterium]